MKTLEAILSKIVTPNSQELRQFMIKISRNVTRTARPQDQIQPLPPSESEYAQITMDFITALPKPKKGE